MQTLDDILKDLKSLAKTNNYEGATIDALIYLMAAGIYKNQLNVINTTLELSPTTCTLVNSAIQHAQNKNYSVFRGRNQHIIIKYAIPNETKSVKKFDICSKLGKYKLIYAKDYDFESGCRDTGEIELIICTDILEEIIQGSDKKYIRSNLIDYTEDLAFYENEGEISINGDLADNKVEKEYTNNLNISLKSTNYINKTVNTPYLILTDTDFGLICWKYDKFEDNKEVLFDSNNSYYFKSPKYTEELIDIDTLKILKGFDISESLKNEDGISLVPMLVRDTDVDNIYLESSSAQHSGNIIRSINDIKQIFLNYFSISNIKNCKCYIKNNIIYIIYLLNDKNATLSEENDIKKFKEYLARAYYVTQDIIIKKAWAFKKEDNKVYTPEITQEYVNVTVHYDFDGVDEINKIKTYKILKYSEFELPQEQSTWKRDNEIFLGWYIDDNSLYSNYVILPNKYNEIDKKSKINVTKDITLRMRWINIDDYKPKEFYDLNDEFTYEDFVNLNTKLINIYSDSENSLVKEDDFYLTLMLIKNSEKQYIIPEIINSIKPYKYNKLFDSWYNTNKFIKLNESQINNYEFYSNTNIAVLWNDKFHKVTFFDSYDNQIVINKNIIHGESINESDFPDFSISINSTSNDNIIFKGWYYQKEIKEEDFYDLNFNSYIEIEKESNLDNFKDNNCYLCHTKKISKTIVNKPDNDNTFMLCVNKNDDIITQIIVFTNFETYHRNFISKESGWSDWSKELDTTKKQTNTTYEYLKFDMGTKIVEDNVILTSKFDYEFDFDIEVFFDAPINNAELHSYIDSFSYNIGETFEPLKLISQISKKYPEISWINLKSSKSNVKIDKDSYFDFSYNVNFTNNISELDDFDKNELIDEEES